MQQLILCLGTSLAFELFAVMLISAHLNTGMEYQKCLSMKKEPIDCFQIQLVGFNARLYPNLTVASSKNHGIVVVSILVQVSETSLQVAVAQLSISTTELSIIIINY